MGFNQLNVILGAKIEGFQKAFSAAEKSLNRFSRQLENTGRELTTRLSLPIVAFGAAAVQAFSQFERSAKALEAVTGSAKLTAEQIERLRKIAQAPGLGFEQAVKASARLQAVGLSAQEAEEAIRQFGNAVARSGGGAAEFDGAILALTQIASKGKISAEEINQLNERIFEIRPALEAAFGTSDSEQLEKLGISAEEFIARTTEELSKLARVQGGLANSFENFRDSVRTSLAALGETISKSINLEGVMNRLSDAVADASEWFKNLNPDTQRFAVYALAVAAAIGPVLTGVGALVKVLPLLSAGFKAIGTATTGPIGLAAIAIGAFSIAVIKAYNESPEFREQVQRLWNELKILGDQLRGVAAELKETFNISLDLKDLFGKFTIEITGLTEAFSDLLRSFRDLTSGNIKGGVKNFFAGLIDSSSLGQFARFFGVDIGDKIKGTTKNLNADLREALNPLNEFFERPGAFIPSANRPATTGAKKPTFTRTPKGGGSSKAIESPEAAPRVLIPAFSELATKATDANIAMLEVVSTQSAATEAFEQVRQSLDLQNETLTTQQSRFQAIANTLTGPIQEGFSGFFDTLLSGGKNAFKAFGEAIKALIKRLLTAVATALALSAVFSLITGGAGSALTLLGGSGSGFGGLFKTLLRGGLGFAKGGLVTGPTAALIGEGPGTTRANPEIVAPLDKLQQILGNTQQTGYIASTRIDGNDLLIIVERAERNRNR